MSVCFITFIWRIRVYTSGGRRKKYGGVALSKKKTEFQDCNLLKGGASHERFHIRLTVEENRQSIEISCVHLPSNRFAGSPEKGEVARISELESVLTTPGRPDIVAGDMNFLPASAPYRLMGYEGYVDAAVLTGHVSRIDRRRDYIWLDKTIKERVFSFEVIDKHEFCRVDKDGNKWQLSDHPPLLLEIR